MTTLDSPFEPQSDTTDAADRPVVDGEANPMSAPNTNRANGPVEPEVSSDGNPTFATPLVVPNGEISSSCAVVAPERFIATPDATASILPPHVSPVISDKTVEDSNPAETEVSLEIEPETGPKTDLETGHEVEPEVVGAAVAVLEAPVPEEAGATKPGLPQRLQQAIRGRGQASLSRLKQRRTQVFLLGAVATFALGGATSYWLRRPTVGPSSLESALALVPNSAVASLSLNANTEPWQQLRQLGTPNLQTGLGEWLAVGRDRIINLGYGDLDSLQQQLAGPPAMALIPTAVLSPSLPGQPTPAAPSDLLLVAPLKNPQAVANSLDQREPPEGFENSISSHRGIKIWDLQVDLLQRQSVAIFGNFGLLASDRTTIEQAIDSYHNGTALADLNEYEDAQRRLEASDLTSEEGALLSFYINSPAAVLSNQAAGRLLPLPAALQGLVSQVRLTEGDGLAINSIAWDQTSGDALGVLGQAAPKLGNKSEAMVALGDRFPASTSFILSGSDLQEAWRSFSQGKSSATSLLSPSAIQQQVQTVTSMDLQQDWLSWMDGPYSVGILPIPTQANSRFQTGLTVMAQTSNRRLAERSLQKLDALMVNKYGLTLSTSQLDGENVVNWANSSGEAVVTHGWLEGNVAFLIVGAPGANLILPQPRATLAASRLYREGMPREGNQQDPAGVLFVDVDRVLDTQLPSLLPLTPASRPVLEQLKSIGVERRPLDERFSRYDLSLKFLPRSAAPPVKAPVVTPDTTPESGNPESGNPELGNPESGNPDQAIPESMPPESMPSESSVIPEEPAVFGPPSPGPVVTNAESDPLEAPGELETLDSPEATEPLTGELPGTLVQDNQPPARSSESSPLPSAAEAVGDSMIGPVFPDNPTEFGPQIPSNLSQETEETRSERAPSENQRDLDEEAAIAAPPEPVLPEDPALLLEQSQDVPVSRVKEDVIVDPSTANAVRIGPPVPSQGFDFTPLGPKLPRPEAQQWSDSFLQEPDE